MKYFDFFFNKLKQNIKFELVFIFLNKLNRQKIFKLYNFKVKLCYFIFNILPKPSYYTY